MGGVVGITLEVIGSSIVDAKSGDELGLSELVDVAIKLGTTKLDIAGRAISISKSPAELGVFVHLGEHKSQCQFVAHRNGNEVLISEAAKGAIIGQSWHPIRSSDFARIKTELAIQGLDFAKPQIDIALKLNAFLETLPFELKLEFEAVYVDVNWGDLKANPYPYQHDGIQYLSSLFGRLPGVILADEMGLGKTLQVIGLLLQAKSSGAPGPNLVIAPASLLENWSRELKQFAPSLRVVKRLGENRSFEPGVYLDFDVVISSYDLLVNDIGYLNTINWGIVVADEAQYIKNPTAKRTAKVNQLSRYFSLAVTGTPFENHLTDLWSLTNFVFPNYLNSLSEFVDMYPDVLESAEKLEPKLSPIMLRRRVKDVQKDLPERIDSALALEAPQSVIGMQNDILANKAVPKIGKLTSLRSAAAHATGHYADFVLSPKFEQISNVLESAFSQNEKVLIFSSFNQTSEYLQRSLREIWPKAYIDAINGDSPAESRQGQVDEFAAAGFGALILNPKAAGVGLNITAARHVIHFNPEWNPALTEQASKRAHRNGQLKTVFVHYLYYADTIEDLIVNTQEFKKMLGLAVAPGVSEPLSLEVALAKLANK